MVIVDSYYISYIDLQCGYIINSILQMKKMRLRKVMLLHQGYKARKWKSQG